MADHHRRRTDGPRRGPGRGRVNTDDLWRSVDKLTKPGSERNPSTAKGRAKHLPVPSLWRQLVAAQASDNSGGERGKASPGSRAPLDLNIASLLAEMARQVVDALVAHDVHPHRRDGDDRTRGLGIRLLDVPACLRQLPEVLRELGDQALVDEWADRYWSWVTRAQEALGLDEDSDLRDIWGEACPACLTTYVTNELDSASDRRAAIAAKVGQGLVLDIRCRACGRSWPFAEGYGAGPLDVDEHADVELDDESAVV